MNPTFRNLIIVAIVLLIGLTSYFEINHSEHEPPVPTGVVDWGTVERKLKLPGSIVPNKEIRINAHLSGVVEELYVTIGQSVQRGTPIARIQPVASPLEYDKLLKNLEIIRVKYRSVQQKYERSRQLYAEKVIPAADMEIAEAELATTRYEFEMIKSELDMLNNTSHIGATGTNLVRATSNGTILELPIKVGGAVQGRGNFSEGTTVAKVANLQALYFLGSVSENDLNNLKPGQRMRIFIPAVRDSAFEATLRLIAPQGAIKEDGTARFDIYADLSVPRTGDVIRAGYSATAEMTLERRKHVLCLDEKYLQFTHDSVFVDVQGKNGIVSRKFITLGISDGIRSEVLSGLNVGERIREGE